MIQKDKGIIIACDCDFEIYSKILRETKELEEIVGYKLGSELSLYGRKKIVLLTKNYTDKPLIYDHQKGGTDVSHMGKSFANSAKDDGVDAVILFPRMFNKKAEIAYITAAKEKDLSILVGGLTTEEAERTKEFNEGDVNKLSTIEIIEYIALTAGWQSIYKTAIGEGVANFVLPGNILEITKEIKDFILKESKIAPIFYTPGIGAQGGKLSELAELFKGSLWYPIIGRSIYESPNIKEKVRELINQMI